MPPSPQRSKEPTPRDVTSLPASPVYLLFGNDEYLVSTNARKLVDHLCPPAEQAFGLEVIEGQDTALVGAAEAAIQACRQALQTVGFFGGAKTVWFRDVVFFDQARVRDAEAVQAALDPLIASLRAGLGDGVCLVVSARGMDKRSRFYRACKEAGQILEYALPEKTYQLEAHARETAASLFSAQGMEIHPAVLDQFVAKVGADTRQLANEVEKLAVYAGDRRKVDADDIRAVVSASREASSWDLQDALGYRDAAEAFRLVGQLLFQGVTPLAIVNQLEGRFRELMVLRNCLDRDWCRLEQRGRSQQLTWSVDEEAGRVLSALARDPRDIHPWRAGQLAAQAKKYQRKEILRIQELLAATHDRLVRSSLPPRLTLELALVRVFAGAPP